MGWLERLQDKIRSRRLWRRVNRTLATPTRGGLEALRDELLRQEPRVAFGWEYIAERLAAREDTRELLAELVADASWPSRVRVHGLRLLSQKQHRAALRLADALMERDEPIERSILAECLGQLDDPATIPYLERLLEDEAECADMWAYWRVMDEAARALVKRSARGPALDRWIAARRAELNTDRREGAAISLGYVVHPDAIEPLVESALAGNEWPLDVLETYRSPEVSRALCAALARAGEPERRGIAYALGKNGDPDCVPALARLLASDEPAIVRFAAARGLRWLEHDDARRVLASYRDDPDPEIRAEVSLMDSQPAAR